MIKSIGFEEWKRSIKIKEIKDPPAGSGQFDFFWLGLLLWAFCLLVFLGAASGEGLLRNLLDASLGHVKGYGAPIRLEATPYLLNGQASRSPFHPSRRAELQGNETLKNLDPWDDVDASGRRKDRLFLHVNSVQSHVLFPFPGEHNREPNTTWWSKRRKDEAPLEIWAVQADDPLWMLPEGKYEEEGVPTPLEVVLDKNKFTKYFKCSNYYQGLPSFIRIGMEKPPEKDGDPFETCLKDERIWLGVSVGEPRGGNVHEYVPFHFRTVDRIPTIGDVAMLFPLRTLLAMELSRSNPKTFRYFAEWKGMKGEYGSEVQTRIKALRFDPDAERSARDVAPLLNCLGARDDKASRGGRIKLPIPLSASRVKDCAAHHRWEYDVETSDAALIPEEVKGHYLDLSPDGKKDLVIPCDILSDQNRAFKAWRGRCAESRGKEKNGKENALKKGWVIATLERISGETGFASAIFYIKDRNALTKVVGFIDNYEIEGKKAIDIPRDYLGAIVRFGFISEAMNALAWPVGLTFGGLLLAIIVSQLVSTIAHRRRSYGVKLRLCSHDEVLGVLRAQATYTYLLSFALALIVFWCVQFYISTEIAELFQQPLNSTIDYKDFISLEDDNLLPLSSWMILVFFVGGWGLLQVILWRLFYSFISPEPVMSIKK